MTRHRIPVMLGLLLLLGLTFHLRAYWPGIMTYDSVRQYDQALSGAFDDWHPPAMGWIWQRLLPLGSGPAPMLLLQLLLYWSGFALLAGWALREDRRGLAILLLLSACAPIPIALMGAVLKDCLMTGALLCVLSLLALARPYRDAALRLVGIALLLFTATLRFNAFLAALPLLLALLPAHWRDDWRKGIVATLVATLLLLGAMPLANRLIGAEPSDVQFSQMIFDMGGITEFSGTNVFPPLPVRDPVAVNHHCYDPVKWDSYSWWVETPCPIGFELIRQTMKARHQSLVPFWIKAILHHPLAYAEHRLAHFNINSRFLIHDEVERPVQSQSAPNPWGFQVAPGPLHDAIDGAALATSHTPLGWPILWLALALGLLIVAPRLPSRAILIPLILSILLYGFGYLVLSVAAEMRYHLWTILGTAIAVLIAASDLARGARLPRSRILLAVTPVMIVAILCSLWRL